MNNSPKPARPLNIHRLRMDLMDGKPTQAKVVGRLIPLLNQHAFPSGVEKIQFTKFPNHAKTGAP